MAETSRPSIVQAFDDTELRPGGGVRPTTRVRFMVGELGPFEHVFDRNPSEYDINQALDARAAQFAGRM